MAISLQRQNTDEEISVVLAVSGFYLLGYFC